MYKVEQGVSWISGTYTYMCIYIYIIIKYTKSQKYTNIQNINDGCSIWKCSCFIYFYFLMCLMYFCIVGVFSIIHCYFESVYRIRCICLYIWRDFKDMFRHFLKKCPRRVSNFGTNFVFVFFRFCMIWRSWGVLNGPPPPSLASM